MNWLSSDGSDTRNRIFGYAESAEKCFFFHFLPHFCWYIWWFFKLSLRFQHASLWKIVTYVWQKLGKKRRKKPCSTCAFKNPFLHGSTSKIRSVTKCKIANLYSFQDFCQHFFKLFDHKGSGTLIQEEWITLLKENTR